MQRPQRGRLEEVSGVGCQDPTNIQRSTPNAQRPSRRMSNAAKVFKPEATEEMKRIVPSDWGVLCLPDINPGRR